MDLELKIVEKRVKSFYDYLIEKVCGLLWYS